MDLPMVTPASTCLFLETKHEVAGLKGPSTYPSALVVAEALLVDC
jgi:hypothetical protein